MTHLHHPVLSAFAIAEATYDGPIPPAVASLALAIDAARPRTATRIGRVTPKPAIVIERMARAMADRLAAGEDAVTADDLRRAGFTAAQIAAHGEAATVRLHSLLAGGR